jgi:hypothetical protein
MHASKIIEGLSKEGKDDTMKAELLADKQEEIYWMKLPEKVRGLSQKKLFRYLPVDTLMSPLDPRSSAVSIPIAVADGYEGSGYLLYSR